MELLEDPLGDLVEPSPAVTTPPSPVVTFGSDPDYQASESSDSSELDAPAANAAFEYVDGVCRMHGVRTLHLGGEPGFQVFQNVGYFNRTFCE